MFDLVNRALEAPIANILVVAGLLSLAGAVLGQVSSRVSLSKTQRTISGILGMILLVVGVIIHVVPMESFIWRSPRPPTPPPPLMPNGQMKPPDTIIPPLPPGSGQSVDVWLELLSEPKEADVFLSWVLKGRTPLTLHGNTVTGFLVVTKEGYQPWFREINYRRNETLRVQLLPEESSRQKHLLLLITSDIHEEAFSSLRAQLTEQGFTVLR